MKITGKIHYDKKNLQELIKELAKTEKARVKVGVLASNVSREDDGEFNNADIGATHELGSKSSNIPARSFLRVPITKKLPAELKKREKKIFKLITEQGVEQGLKTIGVLAENVVDEAFETSGGGSWPPNKHSTVMAKTAHIKNAKKRHEAIEKNKPLIHTGKLRRSVTSAVVMKPSKP